MKADPVSIDLLGSVKSDSCFFSPKKLGDLPSENRNSLQILVIQSDLGKSILNHLQTFQFDFEHVILKSFSSIKKGKTEADIIPILQSNVLQGIQTVVIGGEYAAMKACFDALQFSEKSFTSTLILPSLGRGIDKTFFDLRRPWLKNLFVLGHRAHLCNLNELGNKPDDGFRSIRLGNLRPDVGVGEPEIRSSQLFGLSLEALKYCEAPIQKSKHAIGLTTEEACQLGYYAGRSEANLISCLFGFEKTSHKDRLSIDLFCTLIWYYIYGLDMRRTTRVSNVGEMKRYTLNHDVEGKKLTFYKDEKEQKWWIKISPGPSGKTVILPCDYADYTAAANEELLSDRIAYWSNSIENNLVDQTVNYQ